MDKISVVIPVYNVEPYIRKCLDSVINQTYTNLDILCINDGSTDKSGIICEEYAKRDSRIRVFHKTNGGLASARNVGLSHLTGDYLGFVDSDDWLEPDMYEALHRVIKDYNVSFSVVSYFMDCDEQCELMIAREKIPDRVLNQEEMLLYMSRGFHYAGFFCSVCNKLFRTSLIYNNKLAFDNNLRSGEDVKFLTDVILRDGCTGYYLDKPFYHYYQRQNSLVNLPSFANTIDSIISLQDSIEMIKDRGFGDTTLYLKRQHCYYASLLVEEAIKNKNHEMLKSMQ